MHRTRGGHRREDSFPACIVGVVLLIPSVFLSLSFCLAVCLSLFSSWSRFSDEAVSLVFVTQAGQDPAGVEAPVTGPHFAESEVKLVAAHHYDNVFLVGKGAKHVLAGFSIPDPGHHLLICLLKANGRGSAMQGGKGGKFRQ